ncbi:hypothetical protein J6590_104784, partial [Homalodisca vitripennis]
RHNYTDLADSSREAVFVHIACCGVTTFTQQVGTETEGDLADSSREAVFVHIACCGVTTFTQQVGTETEGGACVVPQAVAVKQCLCILHAVVSQHLLNKSAPRQREVRVLYSRHNYTDLADSSREAVFVHIACCDVTTSTQQVGTETEGGACVVPQAVAVKQCLCILHAVVSQHLLNKSAPRQREVRVLYSRHNYKDLADSSREAVFVHIACCDVTTCTQQVGTETEGDLADSSREAVFVHIACCDVTTCTQQVGTETEGDLADSSREAVFVHIACCDVTTCTQQVGTETEGDLADSSREAVFVHIACCDVTTCTQQIGTETEGGLADSSREAVFVHIACCGVTTFTQQVGTETEGGACVVPVATITQT